MAATVRVVAGILENATGQVLLTERLGDSAFAGLWEFPGGKISDGETSESALRRELMEELGIDINKFEYFTRVDHSYADRCVSIEFFIVSGWSSEPRGLEGQGFRWSGLDGLDPAELLPADAPVVSALRHRAELLRKCLSET
ncbi:MAG: 8-oxo-dGTP diphosphatase MutT [Woeseiaceae bacterium]